MERVRKIDEHLAWKISFQKEYDQIFFSLVSVVAIYLFLNNILVNSDGRPLLWLRDMTSEAQGRQRVFAPVYGKVVHNLQ